MVFLREVISQAQLHADSWHCSSMELYMTVLDEHYQRH